MFFSITAHCLIKNEENFIAYSIRSIIDYVEKIIIFDTGSHDKSVEIIKELIREYPNKISFEEKGECDKKRHTELRQEMLEKTTTPWFMILDGDEIWTKQALQEVKQVIEKKPETECVITPFYLCVGDIFHFSKRGKYNLRGRTLHATPRFFKKTLGIHWSGMYNQDILCDKTNQKIFEKELVVITNKKFWHVSHLKRSTLDEEEYSSGGIRRLKIIPTYFLIGKKITEPIPEVFDRNSSLSAHSLSFVCSLLNFIIWGISKVLIKIFKLSRPFLSYDKEI